ncbi:hypothetical protein NM208_g12143 [Fusarium decemcellulare]|uniref:Uncharacterized protein n=1 Tax=Fusarium decemcellulare TaxID=57161 RepID=A0ACC1RSI7_9HYPO|nr:hypothetical protein NM208_g12143 [Fusarium decemcellulare]
MLESSEMNSNETVRENVNSDVCLQDLISHEFDILSNDIFPATADNPSPDGPHSSHLVSSHDASVSDYSAPRYEQIEILNGFEQMDGVMSFPTAAQGASDTLQFPVAVAVASNQVDKSSNDASGGQPSAASAKIPSKMATRFTRESVRILRNWFLAHSSDPFPNETEKKRLQEETGLTRAQIMTWFANARRRIKVPRSISNSPGQTQPRDIPRRPGTPAPVNTQSSMNPLERWVDSPPENEAASVSAIARAVASSPPASLSDSSYTGALARSTNSSISSGGSRSSVDSRASRSSLGSFEPLKNSRSRRRRRTYRRVEEKPRLGNVLKKFQCTFCTDSFNRKYDWQRHENSVHLPLERWICISDGPRARNLENQNLLSCVFCGLVDPDDAHIESHNCSACKNRPLNERSFNRKDHLRQHLRLFHNNSTFLEWSMASWRVPVPDIRWGGSMADWKGDWGFDPEIFDSVENAMPPWFIEFERHTPYPFQGGKALVASPRSAYELLKLELAYFMQRFHDNNDRMPGIQDMQFEACRIILASESMGHEQQQQQPISWLRDLIVSDQEVLQRAKLSPVRSAAETRLYPLQVKGKATLFESCPFEAQLRDFIQAKSLLHLSENISDTELRDECCRIIGRMEEVSTTPSDFIATWLVRLIHSEGDWLVAFRERSNMPLVCDLDSLDPTTDVSIYEYTRLDRGVAEYLEMQRAKGIEPNDDDLRRQARIVVGQDNDGWTTTAADNELWLASFKRRHKPDISDTIKFSATPAALGPKATSPATNPSAMPPGILGGLNVVPWNEDQESLLNARSLVQGEGISAINDWNYYQWFEDELRRWAVATMSPRNPMQHTPTDEEFQHYARMMAYNDDDPMNQTIADDPAFLGPLKISLGILND